MTVVLNLTDSRCEIKDSLLKIEELPEDVYNKVKNLFIVESSDLLEYGEKIVDAAISSLLCVVVYPQRMKQLEEVLKEDRPVMVYEDNGQMKYKLRIEALFGEERDKEVIQMAQRFEDARVVHLLMDEYAGIVEKELWCWAKNRTDLVLHHLLSDGTIWPPLDR